jgi:hypothetical protein
MCSPPSVPHQTFRVSSVTTGMSDGINIEIEKRSEARASKVRGDTVQADENEDGE